MLIWCLNNVQDLKKHYENTQEFLNVYLTFNISTRSVGPPAILCAAKSASNSAGLLYSYIQVCKCMHHLGSSSLRTQSSRSGPQSLGQSGCSDVGDRTISSFNLRVRACSPGVPHPLARGRRRRRGGAPGSAGTTTAQPACDKRGELITSKP